MSRFPDFSSTEYDGRRMRQFVASLEQRLSRLETAFAKGYAITGTLTPLRTLNAETATTDQVRDFVATLVTDLLTAGKLAGED